ncbi:hypothetical protein JCM18899A_13960 [Nocardioides sp. AN3]
MSGQVPRIGGSSDDELDNIEQLLLARLDAGIVAAIRSGELKPLDDEDEA